MTLFSKAMASAILAGSIGSTTMAEAQTCTHWEQAEMIRDRFASDHGFSPAIVSDPRAVTAITGALLTMSASSAMLHDRDSYLVVGVAGMLLVYRVSGAMVCTDAMVPISGRLAVALVKRLQEICKPEQAHGA